MREAVKLEERKAVEQKEIPPARAPTFKLPIKLIIKKLKLKTYFNVSGAKKRTLRHYKLF